MPSCPRLTIPLTSPLFSGTGGDTTEPAGESKTTAETRPPSLFSPTSSHVPITFLHPFLPSPFVLRKKELKETNTTTTLVILHPILTHATMKLSNRGKLVGMLLLVGPVERNGHVISARKI